MKLPKELNTVTPLSKSLAIVLFIVLPIVGFFLGMRYQDLMDFTNKDKDNSEKACTLEAKMCPDGSAVGRTGPNCEFSACPSPNPSDKTANWITYKSSLIGVELKFPPTWTADEKDETVNNYVFIKDIASNSEVTIFKNYIGGAAGFREYKEDIELEIAGIKTKKIYFTEDTESQNISAFINLEYNQNKYLIIGKWRINDTTTEKTIDQILATFKFTDQLNNKNLKDACEEKGGTWLETYKECEAMSNDKGFDKSSCTSLGGKFSECDSACRHNPEAEVCMSVCVIVCKF